MGYISAYSMGDRHICEGNIDAEARVTTAWLRRHRVRVLDWPAFSPDLSPIKNVQRIMKRRIRQRRKRTVEQLRSCIH